MLCQTRAFQRGEGFAAGHPGDRLRDGGNRQRRVPRQAKPGGTPADQIGDVVEHLCEWDILPTQNVALTYPSAAQRCQVPQRYVVDVYQIQAGVEGFTMTAGRPPCAIISRTRRSAMILLRL